MSEDKPTERKPAPPAPAPAQNLQLTIDEAEAQGIYANFAIIAHSNSEVILDFARNLPGLAKAKVHARIILTAPNAKALHRALGENLAKFEATLRTDQPRRHQRPGEVDRVPVVASRRPSPWPSANRPWVIGTCLGRVKRKPGPPEGGPGAKPNQK